MLDVGVALGLLVWTAWELSTDAEVDHWVWRGYQLWRRVSDRWPRLRHRSAQLDIVAAYLRACLARRAAPDRVWVVATWTTNNVALELRFGPGVGEPFDLA